MSKRLMYIIKLFVGQFPQSIKRRMRKNLWLFNLYRRSLQKSGLFYGFPSPHNLQRLYSINISQQSKDIAKRLEGKTFDMSFNCCITLVGKLDVDLGTLNNLMSIAGLKNIFVIGDEKWLGAYKKQLYQNYSITILLFKDLQVNEDLLPLLLIRAGDRVHSKAIEMFESVIKEEGDGIYYCDTDRIDDDKRRSLAEFNPDWNPYFQLSTGYVKTGILLSGRRVVNQFKERAMRFQGSSAFALWMVVCYLEGVEAKIYHLPFTLVHQIPTHRSVWHQELLTLGKNSFVSAKGATHEVAKLTWVHKTSPLVSLIIPTRNAKALVQTCIESIIEKTNYKNFEILLVDNNSDETDSLTYFEYLEENEPKVRLLKYPHEFNYSAVNNFAVKHAQGQIIGLVNNDIEVISRNWLESMVGHVMREDIGCVGAKLLYPDDRIQHAGVVMGYGGGAGHAHKYFPRYHPGYMNRLIATQNFSAVTAACLLVTKADYLTVGGLDEENLKVAFNDVDFCLKVLQLGRRNLYCAEAELYHHESVSRGADDTPEKRDRFEAELEYLQKKWANYIGHDPAYNPNLTLKHENFSIRE